MLFVHETASITHTTLIAIHSRNPCRWTDFTNPITKGNPGSAWSRYNGTARYTAGSCELATSNVIHLLTGDIVIMRFEG